MFEAIAMFLVMGGILGFAVYTVIWPKRVVEFRKRKGWDSTSLLTGGVFYATPPRARVMGILLTVISTFGVTEAISRLVKHFTGV